MANRVFRKVSYREFREILNGIGGGRIQGKGYETVIYNSKNEIQAIMHAASIDEYGRCYPATYYVLNCVNPAHAYHDTRLIA